jgi:ectoine hydroxylase-related dioxygenase (phytanoyl-CoA dioxygenase family)
MIRAVSGPGPRATLRLVDSSSLAGDPEALRARAAEDGYLFLRGVVDTASVAALRERYFTAARELGLIQADGGGEALATPGVAPLGFDDPTFHALQQRLLPLGEVAALRRDARVTAVLSTLFGAPPSPHRGLCRVQSPGRGTPAHQDDRYVGGEPGQVWTVWIPLGEAPMSLGPLAVWPRSHRLGLLPHDVKVGEGFFSMRMPEEATWASEDFAPGDAVFFQRLTVHCSLDNVSERLARLSIELRYRGPGDPS